MNTLSAIEVLRYIAAIIKNSPLTKVVDVNGPAVAFLGPGSSTQSRLRIYPSGYVRRHFARLVSSAMSCVYG